MEPRQDRPRQYSQFLRRLVRFQMRGGRIVEGNIHVTEGQSLSVFLATRRVLASLTEARWVGPGMHVVPHLALRTEKIIWASSLDDALPISTNVRAVAKPRWAELVLDDGSVMQTALYMAEEQRLTDYFDSAPLFLPVMQATMVGADRMLGALAINTGALVAIREIEART
jgi:hypothetical protein